MTLAFPNRGPDAGTVDSVRPESGSVAMTMRPVDWPPVLFLTPSGRGLAPTPYRSMTRRKDVKSGKKGLTTQGPLRSPDAGPPLAIPQFGAAVPVDLGLSGLRGRSAPSIEPHGPSSSAVPQPRCRTHPQIGTAMASNALSQLMRFTRFCTMRKLSAARRRRWICLPANRRCCSSRYSTIITVELTV